MRHTAVRPVAGIALPDGLERRLYAFRGLLWRTKSIEAVCAAACGVLLVYLLLFSLDRLCETPRWLRWGAFAGAAAACMAVPLGFHRWIWGHRALEQLARLISRRFPSFGDQLLGAIEIVRGGGDETRSRSLCAAAVGQVAEQASRYDFAAAVPRTRQRLWAWLAAVPLVVACGLAASVPAAAANTWQRLLAPWSPIARYTFARVDTLPERIVVPHGEPVPLAVGLRAGTRWRPATARVRVGGQRPVSAALSGDAYAFELPPQLAGATLSLVVGDARQETRIEPMLRPEMTAVVAEVTLPDYLARPRPATVDVRGGVLGPVKGSRLTVAATANRELAAATVDGAPAAVEAATVRTGELAADASRKLVVAWRDRNGLEGARPLVLTLAPRDDAPPTVGVQDMPGQPVLLASETLKFTILAGDDFGIRQVGIEWQGNPAAEDGSAGARGERIIAAGGGDVESLRVGAAFSPELLGIEPQPLLLRAFVEDFLPGRGRVYSSPQVLYVMDAAEHAVWINDQIAKWKQQAGEVRDRELQLLATNEELRQLDEEQLGTADTRRRIETQAAAEKANARRLSQLVDGGGELVRQAMRNPEFEPQALEELAESLATLDAIASNRMPGVAELLEQAARSPGRPAGSQQSQAGVTPGEKPAPVVGENRAAQAGGESKPGAGQPPLPTPQVVDRESSQQPAAAAEGGKQAPAAGGSSQPGRLGLPSTTVAGAAEPGGGSGASPQPPAQQLLDTAVEAQKKLLEDFAKVADDLAAVLARLEASTFVKRLKLASRGQARIGGRIAGLIADAFGRPEQSRQERITQGLDGIAKVTVAETNQLSAVMDDMQGYFERRRLPAFQTVLEEMQDLDLLGSIRQISDDLDEQVGTSIAQTEFWSDTLDRWADDLVPPPSGGSGSSSGPPLESLPPEAVLEAMRILEDEMNLREETRVAERGRPALAADAFGRESAALARRQDQIAERLASLRQSLADMPMAETTFEAELQRQMQLGGPAAPPPRFANEIRLFRQVEGIMAEASGILRRPDTGRPAIAAETDAIERLLESQLAAGGGGGGGGGGTTPGGGGSGTTRDSALRLVGAGVNRGERREEPEQRQSTGQSGRVLPEEFRQGLDDYFNRFEKEAGRP